MTFTQIPPEYAPLSGELRYTVTTQETATLDLRIADAGNGTLIGAKPVSYTHLTLPTT